MLISSETSPPQQDLLRSGRPSFHLRRIWRTTCEVLRRTALWTPDGALNTQWPRSRFLVALACAVYSMLKGLCLDGAGLATPRYGCVRQSDCGLGDDLRARTTVVERNSLLCGSAQRQVFFQNHPRLVQRHIHTQCRICFDSTTIEICRTISISLESAVSSQNLKHDGSHTTYSESGS